MKTFSTKAVLPLFMCCIINFLSYSVSRAQVKLEMDEYLQEFFLAETVFSQEKNEVQFTLKPLFTKSRYRQLSIPFSVEYGITDRLQLELEVPYIISTFSKQETIRGFGNSEVGILYNIIKANRPFSLSAGLGIPLKTSSRIIRPYISETSWEAFVVAARQFGHIQIHTNLQSEFSEGEIVLNYGVASVFNFGRFSATFEITSEKEEERIFNFTPGLIWSKPNGFEFGLAVSKSLNSSYNDWGVVAMMTYEFSLNRD